MDVSRPGHPAQASSSTVRRRHSREARPSTPPVAASGSGSAASGSAGPSVAGSHVGGRSAGPSSGGSAQAENVRAAAPPPGGGGRADALHVTYRYSVNTLVPVFTAVSVAILLTTFHIAANPLRMFSLAVVTCVASFCYVLLRFALNGGAPVGRRGGGRHFHRLTGERAAYVRTSQRLSMMDRDFTDADYELLLDLDNNSTRLRRFLDGASQDFIDRLPTYLYKLPETTAAEGPSNPELGGETVRRCAICLEDFGEGVKIRILPCFHRFMATCIDPWLLEQGKCPVCKGKVNS